MAFNVNKFIQHFDSHSGFSRASKFDVRIAMPAGLSADPKTTEELSMQCESAELPAYAVNTVEAKIYGAPTYVAASPSFNEITFTFIASGDFWEKKFFDAWLDYIIPKSTYNAQYKELYQTGITIFQYNEGVTVSKDRFRPDNSLGGAVEKLLGPKLGGFAADALESSAKNKLDGYISRKFGNGLKGDLLKGVASEGLQALFGSNFPFSPADASGAKIYGVKLINAFPTTVNAMQLNWATDDIHRLSVAFRFDKWEFVERTEPQIDEVVIAGDNPFKAAFRKELDRRVDKTLKKLFR